MTEAIDETLAETALESALGFYQAEAEALARYMGSPANTTAIEASVTVLALDGGKRARIALARRSPLAASVPVTVKGLERAWTDFLDANPDDLSSPEGLPDHALMTGDQFVKYALSALPSLPAGGQVESDETGWLIELKRRTPTWFQLAYDDVHWTADASKAIRFARKQDAEAYIANIGWTEAFASEHMWCAPRKPAARALPDSSAAAVDFDKFVPGEFKCKKCGFALSQFNMRAFDGAVGERDDPGEKCPNDGSPLWRVTWKERANEHFERAVEEMNRANALASPVPSTALVEALAFDRDKFELWFFRDLSDDQRLALFKLYGMPVDEIGKVHGHQKLALRHIAALAAHGRGTGV